MALPVESEWGGGRAGATFAGNVWLSATATGLIVGTSFPSQGAARTPSAPTGTRVADLYTYDVAECFIVGSDGAYLEVELGADGHFLVLSFCAPRQQSDAHEALALDVVWEVSPGLWSSHVTIPWRIVPETPSRINAFAILGKRFLLHAALPGARPDFHQPAHYPLVGLSSEAAALSTSARAS